MRFSPGCSCCGAEDCAGCLPLMPASVFVEVTAVTGSCASDFAVGQSWEVPLALTEADRKVYRNSTLTGDCSPHLEVFLVCGDALGGVGAGKYVITVSVSQNAYPAIPANVCVSGGGTGFNADCSSPVDFDLVLGPAGGCPGCCSPGAGSVTVAVTE